MVAMDSDALLAILQDDRSLTGTVDEAFGDSARRSGVHLVCHAGCTQCCYGAFEISPLDALRLQSGMAELRRVDPAKAEAVETRARRYVADFASDFPGDRSTGVLGASEAEREAFEVFANEAACPALDITTGLCDVYEYRPMTCRVFGPPVRAQEDEAGESGLAVCELCFTEASEEEIAAAEMVVPHEQEERLAQKLGRAGGTIVAYCLLPQRDSTADSLQE
jgi:Fe-S-cluster containining protein